MRLIIVQHIYIYILYRALREMMKAMEPLKGRKNTCVI